MGKLSMSRRTFMKTAAVAAGAAALSGSVVGSALADGDPGAAAGAGEIKRIRSCCRGCGKMECGVWVLVQDGKVIRTEGDTSCFSSMGNHCAKGQASLQAAYHPDRLKYPMVRTNPKGDDDPGWKRITWDEAEALMGEKFKELQAKYGYETYFSMGGTSRIWAMGPYMCYKQCFHSPNAIQANEICKGPRFFATKLDASNAYSWMEVVGRPRVYVQWGGASELSNYDDSCRTTVDVATRAQTHILVDPRMTNLGKEADIWLPLRPGTDAAMALGWINVIIDKGLYDELYVRKWMNAPMLVVDDPDFEPTEHVSTTAHKTTRNHLLKEADLVEGGRVSRYMVVNELTGELSWFDAEDDQDKDGNRVAPHWEGETWEPATASRDVHQPGVDFTGQTQGVIMEYTPFPEGLYPALYTDGGYEVTLKDGKKVKVRTVWEHLVDHVADYTPEKVAEICGVPAADIERAAVTYATPVDPASGYGNGGIQYMLANEHSCNSTQTCRALDLICGITGNMDVPGGMRGSTPGWPFFDLGQVMPNAQATVPTDNSVILGSLDFPCIGSECSAGWADANSVYRAIETGDPYPVTCGIGETGDHMNQCNSLYAYEQLKKLDFWVSIDLWQTPTVGMADLVLPAAHWLELDCLRKSQGSSGGFGATCRAIEPPGEAKSDLEIHIRVFRAMGEPYYNDPENPWPVDDADNVCNGIGLAGFRIPDWQDFKAEYQEHGWFDSKVEKPEAWAVYRRYETGWATKADSPWPMVLDMPKSQGWNTSTRMQEIWSTVLDSYVGPEEALPTFREAPHGPVADPDRFTEENDFLATTGRRQPTYFHSEHRQLPWCRELWPVPRIEMNPADAQKIGVTEGDWVWIETEWGKIREVVDLYYGIAPGVVNLEHQWWYPELEQADKGFKLSCVNCLIDKDAQDPFIGSSNLRAYAVKVYKATADNSPFGNPVPCGNDGTEVIHSADDPRLQEWLPDYEGRI